MDEHELIQELQRFTTRFIDRITQAAEGLERSPSQRVRDEALRKTLGYLSSAMEIATGPYAEIALLDMIVFIHVCRRVLDNHWIPSLYGEAGFELSDAFTTSEAELSDVADRALGPMRREHVASLVDTWIAENPAQIRVEGIRLADFASGAARAAADRTLEAKGILSSVKTATSAANEAMRIVERALFLVHRMPSVWRLQARLAAREIIGDSIVRVSRGAMAAALVGAGGLLIRQIARRRHSHRGAFATR